MERAPDDALKVRGDVSIPRPLLDYRYVTSGGPGGQHANRNRTRVEINLDIDDLGPATGLTSHQTQHLRDRFGSHIRVASQTSRSQFRNRALAEQQLVDLIGDALRPIAPRRATRPRRSAQRRRLASKRRRGELKQSRRPPQHDD